MTLAAPGMASSRSGTLSRRKTSMAPGKGSVRDLRSCHHTRSRSMRSCARDLLDQRLRRARQDGRSIPARSCTRCRVRHDDAKPGLAAHGARGTGQDGAQHPVALVSQAHGVGPRVIPGHRRGSMGGRRLGWPRPRLQALPRRLPRGGPAGRSYLLRRFASGLHHVSGKTLVERAQPLRIDERGQVRRTSKVSPPLARGVS